MPDTIQDQTTAATSAATGPEGGDVASAAKKMGKAASNVASDAMSAVKDMSGKAAEQIKDGAEKGRHGVADTLSKVADHLSETRGENPQGGDWLGSLMGQAEKALRSTASYVDNTKPERYMSDLVEFARRNPAVAIGGAVALGYIVARAGKAAADRHTDRHHDDGHAASDHASQSSGSGYTAAAPAWEASNAAG